MVLSKVLVASRQPYPPLPQFPSTGRDMCSALDRFDMQLAQALGESVFERSLREKVSQESSSARWELGRLQQQLEVRG